MYTKVRVSNERGDSFLEMYEYVVKKNDGADGNGLSDRSSTFVTRLFLLHRVAIGNEIVEPTELISLERSGRGEGLALRD